MSLEEFLKDKYVSDVKYETGNGKDHKIVLVLKNKSHTIVDNLPLLKDICEEVKNYLQSCLVLYAKADCCSESWFEELEYELPFAHLIGTTINKITQTNEQVDLPPSNRQEYDQNTIIRINYDNDQTFDFILINSSNGYYSGWLDIYMYDTLEETPRMYY